MTTLDGIQQSDFAANDLNSSSRESQTAQVFSDKASLPQHHEGKKLEGRAEKIKPEKQIDYEGVAVGIIGTAVVVGAIALPLILLGVFVSPYIPIAMVE